MLFTLLADGKIKPIIAAKFSILEAAKGYTLLKTDR
jgi:hypothetical protein